MKWNWGTGIVVGMVAFMSFIMYMVITMITDSKYSHDLVTEEYYAKEIVYQTEIDAEANAINLNEKLKSERTPEGWLITFPSDLEPSKIKGNAYMYRPSNQKLDFELPINISKSELLIPDAKMIGGRWNITLDFTYDGKAYLYKKAITY